MMVLVLLEGIFVVLGRHFELANRFRSSSKLLINEHLQFGGRSAVRFHGRSSVFCPATAGSR
jgi:hypothetical protein